MKSLISVLLTKFGGAGGLVILGRLAYFLFFFLFALKKDVDVVAAFATSLALCQIMSSIASLGLAQASQAIIPRMVESRDARLSSYINSTSLVTVTSIVSVVVCLVFAIVVFDENISKYHVNVLIYVCSLFPIFALSYVREFISRSFNYVVLAYFPRDVAWMVLLVIGLFITSEIGLTFELWSVLTLILVELTATLMLFGRLKLRHNYIFKFYDSPLPWLKDGRSFLSSSLGGMLFERIDTLFVSYFMGASATAAYSVASRMAPVVSMCQRFIVPVLINNYSKYLARDDRSSIERTMKLGVIAALFFSVPIFLVFYFFCGQFLALFGEVYETASPVFKLLIIAHFAISIGSVFGAYILASDHRRVYGRILWGAIFLALVSLFCFAKEQIVYVSAVICFGIVGYNLTFVAFFMYFLKR